MFCDSVFAALRDPIVDQLDAETGIEFHECCARAHQQLLAASKAQGLLMLKPFLVFLHRRRTQCGFGSGPPHHAERVQARKEVLARARGLPDRAWRRLLNAPACGSASRPRSRVSQGALWLNGFAAVSGKLVDHICDPPIAGTDKDDGIVAILNEERMGLCLRHFVRDFWRHRV